MREFHVRARRRTGRPGSRSPKDIHRRGRGRIEELVVMTDGHSDRCRVHDEA